MNAFPALVRLLKKLNYRVAAAESCTAGLFSAHIADTPGASDVMKYGFVVYSEEAKTVLVGVLPETIARFGVVSEETACEMARGAAEKANAQCGVGITGFAGPSADENYPVGRVCFGYCINGNTVTEKIEFGSIGRNAVRKKAAEHAAEKLLSLLTAGVQTAEE